MVIKKKYRLIASFILNFRGINLVELLVSMGIMSFATLGVAYQMKLLTQVQKNVNNEAQFSSFTNYLSKMISTDLTCPKALGVLTWIGNPGSSLQVNLPAGNSSLTSISIFNSAGVIASANVNSGHNQIGVIAISKLNLVLTGKPQAIPNSSNSIYSGFINIVGTKKIASLSVVGGLGSDTTSFNVPLQAEVTPGGSLVHCSGTGMNSVNSGTNQASVNTSQSCGPGQFAQVTTDANHFQSIICRDAACPSGSVPNGVDSSGKVICSASCPPAGATVGVAYGINSSYGCVQLTCPAGQVPITFDSQGFIATCDLDTNHDTPCVAKPSQCSLGANGYESKTNYECPSGRVCLNPCTPTMNSWCWLSGNQHTTDHCKQVGGTVVGNIPDLYCQTNGYNSVPTGFNFYSATYSASKPSVPAATTTYDNNGGCSLAHAAGSHDSADIQNDADCLARFPGHFPGDTYPSGTAYSENAVPNYNNGNPLIYNTQEICLACLYGTTGDKTNCDRPHQINIWGSPCYSYCYARPTAFSCEYYYYVLYQDSVSFYYTYLSY